MRAATALAATAAAQAYGQGSARSPRAAESQASVPAFPRLRAPVCHGIWPPDAANTLSKRWPTRCATPSRAGCRQIGIIPHPTRSKEAAMTTAAADTHSDTGSHALTSTRRVRVDLIGLGALIFAGLGLAGTIVLTQTRPAERPTTPGVPAVAVAPAPPMRDQWY